MLNGAAVRAGEYNLVISEITDEDNALFECQVGATEHTGGLASRKAKLTVQGQPEPNAAVFYFRILPPAKRRAWWCFQCMACLSVCLCVCNRIIFKALA